MDRPDLNLLAALDALLQTESVGGAAELLGLSPPAMSHALSRLRAQLGDPLLVRAGSRMVMTPRALALKERARGATVEATALLSPPARFVAEELRRAFVVHASDNVLAVLGKSLHDGVAQSPGVTLRFRPNAPEDAVELREGRADLAIGIYGELPPELRTRPLYSDRFVCAVRRDHPTVGERLSLEAFLSLEQIQVAPRGRTGGLLDASLEEQGLRRHVSQAIPFFLAALQLVSETDAVVTLPERVARTMAGRFGLRVLEPPLKLVPYTLSMVWHPRMDGDAAHRWLREAVLRAARAAAPGAVPGARTRLADQEVTPSRRRRRRSVTHGR
jgi:DNA-binding transcriptional LysR family regulator